MSLIVAVTDGTRVVMGADTGVGNDTAWYATRTPKIIPIGWPEGHRALVGFIGTARFDPFIRQIALQHFCDDHTSAVPAIGEWLYQQQRNAGLLGTSPQGTQTMFGECLLASQGRLFHITTDGGVWEPADPYFAIGCGDLAARAVCRLEFETPPANLAQHEDIVGLALETAAALTDGVRPPWQIEAI